MVLKLKDWENCVWVKEWERGAEQRMKDVQWRGEKDVADLNERIEWLWVWNAGLKKEIQKFEGLEMQLKDQQL